MTALTLSPSPFPSLPADYSCPHTQTLIPLQPSSALVYFRARDLNLLQQLGHFEEYHSISSRHENRGEIMSPLFWGMLTDLTWRWRQVDHTFMTTFFFHFFKEMRVWRLHIKATRLTQQNILFIYLCCENGIFEINPSKFNDNNNNRQPKVTRSKK